MAITNTIGFGVIPSEVYSSSFSFVDVTQVSTLSLYSLPQVEDSFGFYNSDTSSSSDLFFRQIGSLDDSTSLYLKSFLNVINFELLQLEESISNFIGIQSVVGDVFPHSNPIKKTITLHTIDTFYKLTRDLGILVGEERLENLGYLSSLLIEDLEHIVNLTITDIFGPRLDNIVPPSGSTFNPQISPITFDLIDNEGTNINIATVDLFVNGTQVISGGSGVSPSGFGDAFLTKIDDDYYEFSFTPTNPFGLAELVVVSGQAADVVTPSANISEFLYSFKILDEFGLSAVISGSPDILSPYLLNLNPGVLETGVPVDSNVLLDVIDDHTGVDADSVILSLNNVVVFSGSTVTDSSFANVSTVSISGGKGVSYSIDPVDDLELQTAITVEVSAADNFSISPNLLDTSYTFITMNNSHLVASGFQIYTDSSYEDFDLETSWNIQASGVDFRVQYINLNNLGINVSGSYVSCNGSVISGSSFVSVSGVDVYDVFFNVVPDFTTDCDLVFHLEQLTLESGKVISRDIDTRILWGAEYCYSNEEGFNHDDNIFITAKVCDQGDLPTTSPLSYKITTAPLDSNRLTAIIVGSDTPFLELGGEVISNNPYFEPGKEMTARIEVEDFAGNKLDYTWNFKISEDY